MSSSAGSTLLHIFYRPQIGAKKPGAPESLGIALAAACLYAAFAHGAIRSPQEPRLQVGIAVIAALATGAWLWFGALSLRAPVIARGALGLLFAFTAWSAVTLIWSTNPDGTWIEVNRLFTYTLILGLAIALGTTARHALSAAAGVVLALSLTVAVYALAQKIIPGLHIDGIIDLDQTASLARLQAPLDYWNALALCVTLGAPAGLILALGAASRRKLRLVGLIGLELIVITVGFTESRGGFVALAVALGVTIALSPDRLATLAWAAVAVAAGTVDLVVGLAAHPLTADGIPQGRRELAGLYLLVVIVAVAVLSALAIGPLDRLPAQLTRARRRSIWRLLGYGSALLLILAAIAATVSHRGFGGQISHIWSGFNRADSIATSGAGRLLSDSSANRVDWWGQALRAFAARPLDGYGAGSFPVINLLFRHNTITAQDAHSVPLQWLAETGIIGALLALGAWLALLIAGARAVRRAGAGRIDPMRLDGEAARGRLAAAALLAASMAYSVHALYDWDWDIPGVTLPVLVMLGVLAGSLAHDRGPVAPVVSVVPEAPAPVLRRAASPTARLLGLLLLIALFCCFGVSAVLPGVAATKADAALSIAAEGTPAAFARARHDAAYAGSLDPLSGAGPMASANVALGLGELALARGYLIEALQRQPADEAAWTTLIRIDLGLGRDGEALTAVRRVFSLDPAIASPARSGLLDDAIAAQVAAAPPTRSATAISTPGG